MENINFVWENIKKHEGEIFYTVKGLEFTFEVSGNTIKICRDGTSGPKQISKNYFEKALEYKRYDCKDFRNKIWGHSYVRGMLEDKRIK